MSVQRGVRVAALACALVGCTSGTPRVRGGTALREAGAEDASRGAPALDAGDLLDARASRTDARSTSMDAAAPGDACAAFGPVTAEAAPEIPEGLDWLNTAVPYTLAGLRGRVVLLDFWTYGCINCLHQIPIVNGLEELLAGEPFVVIGVHSAKFSNEKDKANISLAMQQYEVHHPVVVDDALSVWNEYGAHAWPTTVLIDARGRKRLTRAGEYNTAYMRPKIDALLEEARCEGSLAAPVDYRVDPNALATTPLLFPTGLAPLTGGGLAISDSSHHRIVVMQGEGQLRTVYGTGTRGNVNGDAATAAFSGPQGIAAVGDTLYVADTGNHEVRAIDLASGTVRTVAGTGIGGSGYTVATGFQPALSTRLDSPWDVEPVGSAIAIASAGSHQIYLLDPALSQFRVLSGSGKEDLKDGTAATCAFAQPSGVALSPDGGTLYVADAESSAIRAVSTADGSCTTLVGRGLFTYGDRDGVGSDVLLQHASALDVLGPDELVVADTYNDKLKRLVPSTRTATAADFPPGDLTLYEPRGVARVGSTLYVSDTNHHRVLSHDLGTGETHVYDTGTLAPPPR
ncbi:MAG TPA: thioredoxin-like domain-containing protein [Polyangiaceae bacterium]|nr:thioredoxin-like domain-containing protein [Polyangiaceae bacterium]